MSWSFTFRSLDGASDRLSATGELARSSQPFFPNRIRERGDKEQAILEIHLDPVD